MSKMSLKRVSSPIFFLRGRQNKYLDPNNRSNFHQIKIPHFKAEDITSFYNNFHEYNLLKLLKRTPFSPIWEKI